MSIAISPISQKLNLIYQIVSEKVSLKKPKIYKECMSSRSFLTVAIFFVTDSNELKLAQTL